MPADKQDALSQQFDRTSRIASAERETIPGLGHALELRIYRCAGALHLHWWYDTRRITPATAQALADQFRTALTELTRQAMTEDDINTASDELTLVDLSSTDTPA